MILIMDSKTDEREIKILVVDDVEIIRRIMEKILNKIYSKFNVIVIDSGEEALKVI